MGKRKAYLLKLHQELEVVNEGGTVASQVWWLSYLRPIEVRTQNQDIATIMVALVV
jgi:hypothetical protein